MKLSKQNFMKGRRVVSVASKPLVGTISCHLHELQFRFQISKSLVPIMQFNGKHAHVQFSDLNVIS